MNEERITMKMQISQPALNVEGREYPSQEAVITFGRWFKGDKGDKGDPGEIEHGTTEYWNSKIGYIPKAGEIIVYDDYYTEEIDGVEVQYPNIKIGSGNAFVQDLMFIGQHESQSLLAHLNDEERHITAAERDFWNRKLNVNDNKEVEDETLIFNRK